MSSDFFKDMMRWNVERNGTSVLLPYFYYDNLSLAAVYTASTSAVRKLIPHPNMLPIELTPGRCLVAFACFEYRKCDDDPYNEVSISFLVSYRRRPVPLITLARVLRNRVVPSYVWQLPVTTEAARAGGVDLFGYPKFVADIRFSKNKERTECSLSVLGSDILRMTGRTLPTKQGRQMRYISYAIDKGALVAVNSLVNPYEYAESYDKKDVELEIGKEHSICQVLHEIDLAKNPLVYQFSPRNEAILFPAHNIEDI